MNEVTLDGWEIQSREDLHGCLAPVLPSHYGRNLDALLDCLTEPETVLTLTLVHAAALEEHLGPYARSLRAVLRRAAAENPGILLREEPEVPPESR